MAKIEVKNYGDEIAEAIKSIDKAMKDMRAAGVSQRLLVALIKDYNGRLTKADIIAVLGALDELALWFLEPKK